MKSAPNTGADARPLAATLESVAEAERYHAWLARTIRPHLRSPTLEVGAGIGTLATALAALGMNLLVSEPHPRFARELERLCSGDEKLTVVDSISLPVSAWPESTVRPTTVLLSNVLEHIHDDIHALGSIIDNATSVDRLVIVVPAHMWAFAPLDLRLGHYRRYTKASLRHVMVQAGWDVESMRYFNPLGAVAWAISGRVFGRASIAHWQTKIVEACIPLLASADAVLKGRLFGQSLIAVGQRPRSTNLDRH